MYLAKRLDKLESSGRLGFPIVLRVIEYEDAAMPGNEIIASNINQFPDHHGREFLIIRRTIIDVSL